ncbi:MAG: CAP domain-containing protein [Comamonadaceae bacterium]|nr:MAG: CAP domain-containing protein [Comamonadaceae bacterium]
MAQAPSAAAPATSPAPAAGGGTAVEASPEGTPSSAIGTTPAATAPVGIAPGSAAPTDVATAPDAAADGDTVADSDGPAAPAPAPATTAPAAGAPAGRTIDQAALRANVLKTLKAERERCGFSTVTKNAALDQAALNHGAYLAAGYAVGTNGAHTEVPGRSGFTGEGVGDRARAAGYTPRAVNEAFAHSSLANTSAAIAGALAPSDRAVAHTLFLLSTVYHMQTLLSPRLDLGVGYAEDKGSAAFAQVTVMEFGTRTGAADATQPDLLTYPCQGTTAARAAFVPAKENPNPMPSVGEATVGTPLYLRAPEGRVLVLRSHSVTGPNGAAVATTVLDAANDPAARLTRAQVFVLPQKALTKGATYRVNFAGTIDGTAFTRSFSFQPS